MRKDPAIWHTMNEFLDGVLPDHFDDFEPHQGRARQLRQWLEGLGIEENPGAMVLHADGRVTIVAGTADGILQATMDYLTPDDTTIISFHRGAPIGWDVTLGEPSDQSTLLRSGRRTQVTLRYANGATVVVPWKFAVDHGMMDWTQAVVNGIRR